MKTPIRAVVCLAALALPAMAADGPASDVAELAPLNRLAGSWDVVSTTKPGGEATQELKSKGIETAGWVLDGRFLKQDWVLDRGEAAPRLTGSTLMTYDVGKKAYRAWWFYSTGAVSESAGTWDEASKTMTWTTKADEIGQVSTIKSTFPDASTETWSILVNDRDGKTVVELAGTNRRKK